MRSTQSKKSPEEQTITMSEATGALTTILLDI
jgi:hypothetical protein